MTDSSSSITSCPDCDSPVSLTNSLSTAPPNTIKVGGHLFAQEGYAIYECPHCGLLFKYPAATSETLDEYYAKADFRRWYSNTAFPTEFLTLRELKAVRPNGLIFDFGCSSGRLLTPLTKQFRCYGYEPNADAAKTAAEAGLTMLPNLEPDSFPAMPFDAIILSDVFEHLPSPSKILDLLLSHLAPEGVLVISTGNGDSPICRCDPASFWYFRNMEHLCMLTHRFAEHFAAPRKLNIAAWIETSHYKTSWRERTFQQARHFAYQCFHAPQPVWYRHLLNMLPYLRRAKWWTEPPHYNLSDDHVVAAFRFRGACPAV